MTEVSARRLLPFEVDLVDSCRVRSTSLQRLPWAGPCRPERCCRMLTSRSPADDRSTRSSQAEPSPDPSGTVGVAVGSGTRLQPRCSSWTEADALTERYELLRSAGWEFGRRSARLPAPMQRQITGRRSGDGGLRPHHCHISWSEVQAARSVPVCVDGTWARQALRCKDAPDRRVKR